MGPSTPPKGKIKEAGPTGRSDRDREAAPSRWPIASGTASWGRWAIPVSTPVGDRPETGQRSARSRPESSNVGWLRRKNWIPPTRSS